MQTGIENAILKTTTIRFKTTTRTSSAPWAEAAPSAVGLGHEVADNRVSEGIPYAHHEENRADIHSPNLRGKSNYYE